jgi:hypothetical protein
VAVVRTYVSEESIASIIRVIRIGQLQLLVTAKVVSSSLILASLIMEAIVFSETSILRTATLHLILEDGILLSHRRETSNLISA